MLASHSLLSSNHRISLLHSRPIDIDTVSSSLRLPIFRCGMSRRFILHTPPMAKAMNCVSDLTTEKEMERFSAVANAMADEVGVVIRKYFRQRFEILEKDDLSPVTIADRAPEGSMISIILEDFPTHAVFGEENDWRCKEKSANFVWILDPIDGTKSFITGEPLFGTLISLLHKGKPVMPG